MSCDKILKVGQDQHQSTNKGDYYRGLFTTLPRIQDDEAEMAFSLRSG